MLPKVLFRILASVLALAGMVWCVDAIRYFYVSDQIGVAIILLPTPLLASVLTLVLALKSPAKPQAQALALFLGFMVLGWVRPVVAGFQDFHDDGVEPEPGSGLVWELGQLLPGPVLAAIDFAAIWCGLAAFVHFTAVFPRRLTATDFDARPASRATHWLDSVSKALLRPRAIWGLALGLSLVPFFYLDWAGDLTGVVFVVLMAGLFGVGVRNLRFGYVLAKNEEKETSLWILFAFYLGWGAVFALVLVALGLLLDAAGLESLAALLLLPALVALLLLPPAALLSLFYAVFVRGAIDPALAIRKTAVYGAFGILLIFLFEGVESILSDWLAPRLGLSASVGGWVAGGMVAATFVLLRKTVQKASDRLLPNLGFPQSQGSAVAASEERPTATQN